MDSLLLFTGGKESVYQLHHRQKEIALLLLFNYGQKSFEREKRAIRYYAEHYNKEYDIVELPFFVLPPAIKDGIDCNPAVPQRNIIFTSIAMHIAETRSLKQVFFGAVADSTDYDASADFVDSMNRATQDSPVTLRSATRKYTTGQILSSLMRNKVDISNMWSCDSDDTLYEYCGKCAKCTTALYQYNAFYKDNKWIKKFYQQKYPAEAIIKSLNNEYGSEGAICQRP